MWNQQLSRGVRRVLWLVDTFRQPRVPPQAQEIKSHMLHVVGKRQKANRQTKEAKKKQKQKQNKNNNNNKNKKSMK